MSPSLSTGKPGAAAPKPTPLNTATVRPAQVSPAKRFAPHYIGEPVAGFTHGIRNPDGSWQKPGGRAVPGATLAERPYYTDKFTTRYHAGPAGDPSTQWNAAQVATAKAIQAANYGTPGTILRSLLPGGLDEGGAKGAGEAVKMGADVASLLVPSGTGIKVAGLFGLGLKGFRITRGVKDVAEVVPPAAHMTEEAGVIRAALPGAKIARGKQEAGYSVERGKRFGASRGPLYDPSLSPTARVAKAKGELAGELPKIKFGGFGELNSDSLEAAVGHILGNYHLSEGQKITASDALTSAVFTGRTPTRGEILLLEHVFGKDNAASLSAVAGNPWRDRVASTLNIPRSLMASFDFSAPFRQGLVVATRHPVLFARNLGPMFKAFGNEKVYQAMLDEIHARPSYPLMLEAKLPFTELGRDIGAREERFGSDYAEKLTGGKYGPVRASGRAYTGFLDKTRADVFDHLIQRAQDQGISLGRMKPEERKHFLESLGRYIGAATGRGSIGSFEESAKALNAILFSPRLLASRLNFLNPHWYYKLDPFARKEALRSAFQLTGTVSTLLALASQVPGVKVITNPRNPDFAKIRIGNTRIDIAGGFQQELRFLTQFGFGEAISSTTGKKLSLTAGGFGQPTRLDILLRFIEGKLSPPASFATDWMRGSNLIGQKLHWGSANPFQNPLGQRMIPLLMQDARDLYNENHGGMNGIEAALMGYGIGSVGFGVQTYGPKVPKSRATGGSSPFDPPTSRSGGGSPFDPPSSSGGGSSPFSP